MNKLLKTFVVGTVALSCLIQAMPIFAEEPVSVTVDGVGVQFNQPPVIENGRTLVPLRAIMEALGLQVGYEDATKTVSASKDGLSVVLVIDNKTATVNDKQVELDVPAKIINGSTMVPVRFIGEATGLKVDWDGENSVVKISSEADKEIIKETPKETPKQEKETIPEEAPKAAAKPNKYDPYLGVIDNDVYTNDYFGFTMTLPPDWYAMSVEERLILNNMGTESLVDMINLQDLPLLTLVESKPKKTVSVSDTNENMLTISATKLSEYVDDDSIATTEDFLERSQDDPKDKEMLKALGIKHIWHADKDVMLGKKEFHYTSVDVEKKGRPKSYEESYVRVDGDYLIRIDIFCTKEELKDILSQAAKTIKFK